MAALARGAEAAGRPIAWSTDGRPAGRHPAPPARAGRPTPASLVERDDRILILPRPGLAIIAPPAYAALLLPTAQPAARRRPGDAGVPPDVPREERWRELVARIDAEDSAMPDGAVLMMTASNLLGSGGRRAPRPRRPRPS